MLGLSFLPAVGIIVGAVVWLALAEADAHVAIELDGVAVGELEGVKNRGEVATLAVVIPLAEDVGLRCAPVVVRHSVERLAIGVVDGTGNAVARKSTVYRARLYLHLRIIQH